MQTLEFRSLYSSIGLCSIFFSLSSSLKYPRFLSGGAADQSKSASTRLLQFLSLTGLPGSHQIAWILPYRAFHQLLLDCQSNFFSRYTTFWPHPILTLPATVAGYGSPQVLTGPFSPHSSYWEDGEQGPSKTFKKHASTSGEKPVEPRGSLRPKTFRPLLLRL